MRAGARLARLAALLAALSAYGALAARSLPAQSGGENLAEGRVRTPGDKAPVPVPGLWIILHRVGADRAAPLDSVRSGGDGRFRFRYRRTGNADALYFVSSSYRGIAYFSAPLRQPVVRGGDADLLVYDTTSDARSLHVQGRHVVVSGVRAGKREIAEVFELENDGVRTVVPRDATHPLWATGLPVAAESVRVGMGDLGSGAVSFSPGRGELFAPISPGVRQLVVTYRLGATAFPLALPVGAPVAVLEVLTEEPRAGVGGATLTETSAADIDGRLFRRFVARDVPASAVLRVSVPAMSAGSGAAIDVLAVVMAATMAGALVAWFRRRSSVPIAAAPVLSPGEQLIAELAALDARLERAGGDAASQADNVRARAELKARAASVLAGEGGRS